MRKSEVFQSIQPQASYAVIADNAILLPSVPGIADVTAQLTQAVEAVMAEENSDIQAALDESVEWANQVLEQNRQRYGSR